MPKLLSVNVSLPKKVEYKGNVVETGIFKEPVKSRVNVKTLNIEGDGQADLTVHGGEMRAVYVYSYNNYAFWAKELERDDFTMGQFGENLTVEGMLDKDVHIGDQYKIGSVLFEVSQPRVPCYKLSMKMKDETFIQKMFQSDKQGFYFRVLEEGEIGAQDEIQLIKYHPFKMNITEINSLMYFDKKNYPRIEKAIQIEALSPGWKSSFEKYLAKR